MRAQSFAIALVLSASCLFAVDAPAIHSVSVSKAFFNPTIGQKVDFSFVIGNRGLLTMLILDRDGFVVRTLLSKSSVQAGTLRYDWDGRDDHGRVVPDEAYSPKIDLEVAGQARSYFPASQPSIETLIQNSAYNRQDAVLAYRLPEVSRVFIQAAAPSEPGPKVIADWQPRSAGSVIERWNGYDAAGKRYLPDLPGFSISVKVKPLPKSAVITVGNAAETYRDYVSRRTGASLLTGSVRTGGN